MPVEMVSCDEGNVLRTARLNSFGALGTIAHGEFIAELTNAKDKMRDYASLYRGRADLHVGRSAIHPKTARAQMQTSPQLGGESERRHHAMMGTLLSQRVDAPG